MSRSRSLNKLFDEADGVLATVIARSAALKAIEDQVNSAIPTLLKQQVWLADIRDQTITLICNNNVIANRLRFMEYQILNELSGQRGLGEINQLRVKVNRDWRSDAEQPPSDKTATRTSQSSKAQRISDANAELIEQTSEGIRSPKLAAALKNLASRTTD